MYQAQSYTLVAMEIGGGRRLAVAPDALSVELRGPGHTWARTRVIPYEDIRAVYRYDTTDWGAIGRLVLIWALFIVLLLIAAVLRSWPPTLTLGAAGVVTVLAMIVGLLRAQKAPARRLVIDAYSGSMQVTDRGGDFYQALSARVAPAIPQSAPATSTENSEAVTVSEPMP
jgi:hypothetical protein